MWFELWPAGKGLPGTGASSPEVGSMTKAETPSVSLATYKNFPLGSVVTEKGLMLVANGLPATGVSAPVFALIV